MIKTHKSEDRIQQECYMWFWNTYPQYRGLLFAVPNGGGRSALEGKILKMTGTFPGVSDMLLMYKGTTYCFELKTAVGRQSEKQIAWQRKVEREGFKYFLIRTLLGFQDIVIPIMQKAGL